MSPLALIFLLTSLVGEAEQPPTLSYAERTITVTTPHADHQIALMGVRRLHRFYGADTSRLAKLLQLADGASVEIFSEPIPASTVFVAADLATGRYVAKRPVSRETKVAVLPAGTVKKGEVDDALLLNRTRCQILWIRPKGGAWTGVVFDGGATDADGKADSKITFMTSAMRSLAGGTPPKKYRTGDVIIVIDLARFEVAATEVKE